MIKIHELVKAWAAGWGAKSVDDFLALFTDDCVYEDVPTGRVNRGKEQLAEFARQVMTGFPDFQFEVTSCVATEEGAGIEWVMTGSHTGDYPGMPATGKRLRIRGASFMVFRAGKLQRVSDYWDLAGSGLLPGAAAG